LSIHKGKDASGEPVSLNIEGDDKFSKTETITGVIAPTGLDDRCVSFDVEPGGGIRSSSRTMGRTT
jgi:hypothetical protein